jgi:hypothetical protein
MKPEKVAVIVQDLPAVERAADDLIACPDCGEEVRRELVRCWRCGGFLRGDIAEKYEKMLDAPQKVTYSQVDDDDDALPLQGDDETEVASTDDFILGDGLSFLTPEQVARQQEVLEQDLQPAAVPEPSQEDLDQAVADATARAEAARVKVAAEPETKARPEETKPEETYGLTGPAESDAAGETAVAGSPDSGLAAKKRKSKQSAPSKADTEEDEAPVSTGDPLLDIALQEEREAKKRIRKAKRDKGRARRVAGAMAGYVAVFCPNGHRIQVDEKYRGLTGRCPKCKSMFLVPILDWEAERKAQQEAAEATRKVSRYDNWSLDLHLHRLDPAKLKLKPGSLASAFHEVDVCFTDEGFLVVVHGKQNAGLFAGEKNKKKKEELRVEVQDYLRLDKELLDLPAAGYRFYSPDDVRKSQVVQPAIYAHESMFAGVPVFGEGRIAVRLPVTAADQDTQDIMFLVFHLSDFRSFSTLVEEKFEFASFGQAEGVPLSDDFSNHKCHYSDRELKSIEVSEFHQADSAMELDLIGRKCQACGLVVSEESRKKEKLGGATGKGIAKAKCPKCEQKFGNTSLFGLKIEDEELDTSMSETGGVPSK